MPGKATKKKTAAVRKALVERLKAVQRKPKITSHECSACAVRTDKWFARCPSCGRFQTCFAWINDPRRKALERPRAANPWNEEDPALAGQGGGMQPTGYGGAGGYMGTGGFGDPSPHRADPGADDEDTEEEDDDDDVVETRQGHRMVLPKARQLSRVAPTVIEHVPSGYEPFDEVTAGGAVSGTVSGWTAFPGVGKSTFLLEALAGYAATGAKCVYASVEEPEGDISARAKRLSLYETYKGCSKNLIIIAAETNDPDVEVSDADVARAMQQKEALSDIRAVIAAADKKGAEYLVVDSAAPMHSKDVLAPTGKVGGKNRQLAHVVKTCYARAHRQHEYRGASKMTIFVILHSTKNGDSNVPQEFVHDLDATFVGEHLVVKQTEKHPPEIVAATDQKKPSGMIWFRSHGKNRGGDITLRTICHMTARGLARVGNEEEAIAYYRELRLLQRTSGKLSAPPRDAFTNATAPATKTKRSEQARSSGRSGDPSAARSEETRAKTPPIETYALEGEGETPKKKRRKKTERARSESPSAGSQGSRTRPGGRETRAKLGENSTRSRKTTPQKRGVALQRKRARA